MSKKHFSIDVESADVIGRGSMLSFGATVIGDYSKTFYRELKPLDLFPNYNTQAMKIASLGLECLKEKTSEEYDPKSNNFKPNLVLKLLEEVGTDPKEAMEDFRDWVNKESEGYSPVLWSAPIKYDGGFMSLYHGLTNVQDPFGHSGSDIASFYKGNKSDLSAKYQRSIKIKREGIHHNGLDDAITQGKKLEAILRKNNIDV